MAKKVFNSVEEACFDISKVIERYLETEGIDWMVKTLKTNIIRTVYARKPSDSYDRTDAFKESVRGRLTMMGKNRNSWSWGLMSFADPEMMSPNHISWVSKTDKYKGDKVDRKISDWLDKGHGGMGVVYRPARFIEKSEQIVKDPRGLIRGLHAYLRKNGYPIIKDGQDLI